MVMLGSFVRHHPDFVGELMVVHDDLDPEQQEWLQQRIGRAVGFVPADPSLVGATALLRHRLARFERRYRQFYSLQAISLEGYRKVIFCDSDTLFLAPVRDLFQESSELLACRDRMTILGQRRCRRTFEPAPHNAFEATFNAGFMVFDGSRLGAPVFESALRWLRPEILAEVPNHTDQFVLNHLYEGRVHWLSNRYNFLLSVAQELFGQGGLEASQVRVVHFAGNDATPWTDYQATPPTRVFYEAWHQLADELLRVGLSAYSNPQGPGGNYLAHGLVWRSEVPLEAPRTGRPPDVRIRWGATPEPDASWKRLPYGWAKPDQFLAITPGGGRLWVSRGQEICLDQQSEDPQLFWLYLVGLATGALLLERGELVLHGDAVVLDDRAVVLGGPSGCGKSTLACQLGGRLLCDDVTVVRNSPAGLTVLAGLGPLKPRLLGLAKNGHPAQEVLSGRPARAAIPIEPAGSQFPLAAVYLLDQPPARIRGARLAALAKTLFYRPELAAALGRARENFDHLQTLARTRVVGLESADPAEQSRRILADLEGKIFCPPEEESGHGLV